MTLIYSHITPDDGYFKLYTKNMSFTYDTIYENTKDSVYHCDGYSVNSRHSGIFTSNPSKLGKSFCESWDFVPKRYIYQEMPDLLLELMEVAQTVCTVRKLTEAIVNIYGVGDFIAYHKDYHEENSVPVAVMCSFEEDPQSTHTLEFYRTQDDPKTTRKDRTSEGYSLFVSLTNNSIALMVGMQKRYVHAVQPGKKRISIVFRG